MKQVKNSDSHSSFIEASFVVFFFFFYCIFPCTDNIPCKLQSNLFLNSVKKTLERSGLE